MEDSIASQEAILSGVSDESERGDRVERIVAEWRRERPDLDASPVGVIGRIHRLGSALTDELVAVYRTFGLGEGEFDVLAALRRAGEPFERAPSDLAQHTMVTTGAMTKRIDRLERDGLVTRRPSATDGRGRVVALTPRGLEVIDAAIEVHLANEKRLLAMIPDEDAAALRRILADWIAALD
jgi:DNA-binding MarR family transcriptional regulator